MRTIINCLPRGLAITHFDATFQQGFALKDRENLEIRQRDILRKPLVRLDKTTMSKSTNTTCAVIMKLRKTQDPI